MSGWQVVPKNRALVKAMPIFIDFFERQVAEVQAKVEELRGMERLYITAREVLLECEDVFKGNDVKVEWSGQGLIISTKFINGQHWRDVEPFVRRMGEVLVERGMRGRGMEDPVPNRSWFVTWVWRWTPGAHKAYSLMLKMEVPDEGTDMVMVERTRREVMRVEWDTNIRWIDDPPPDATGGEIEF